MFKVENMFEKKEEKNLVCETVVWSPGRLGQKPDFLKMTRSVRQRYDHWWVNLIRRVSMDVMCKLQSVLKVLFSTQRKFYKRPFSCKF